MSNDHLRLVVDNNPEQELRAIYEQAEQALNAARDILQGLALQAAELNLSEDSPEWSKLEHARAALQTASDVASEAKAKFLAAARAPAS